MSDIVPTGVRYIGLAGDWHGNTLWARHAIATFAQAEVQNVFHLGDFGLGWPGRWGQYISEVAGACIKNRVSMSIVPGNHENWDWIKALHERHGGPDSVGEITGLIRVLPRNFRMELPYGRTLLALGGAPSIDFQGRMEGRDWWRDEVITLGDVYRAIEGGHADIMLAHDAPDGGTDQVQAILDNNPMGWSDTALAYARQGRDLMSTAVNNIKPKLFAHGHYHCAGEKQVGDTKFLSLNCDRFDKNLAVLDLETLDHAWLPILETLPA